MTVLTLEPTERQVRLYRDLGKRTKDWRRDLEDSGAGIRFEQTVAWGVLLFHMLNDLDRAWRLDIARGKAHHEPKVEGAFEHLFELWLEPCEGIEAEIRARQKRGLEVAAADEFRACHKRALAVNQDA